MLAKALRAAVLGLLAFPSAALALGLGDIRLNSALNSPLDAEIELIGASAEDLASLRVNLASRETFARYGLERPQFLGSVAFETTRSGDRDVIRVRTTETVTEPFVTLLIEAGWAKGRLVREYTVLLDPPVYSPAQAAAAPVAAPAAGAGLRSGSIQREAAAAPEPMAEPPAAPPAASGARDQSYTVKRGDSLSSIARELSGEASPRLMVGLYRANPEAFDGDMNSLRTGAILRVPASQELAAITGADANAEVRRQYAAWRERAGATDTGRLRLVTPAGDGGSAAASAAGAAEMQGLRDRITALESELSQSRRLIELRNAELAELQSKLAAAQRPAATPAAQAPAVQPAEAPAAAAPADELAVEAPAAEAPSVAEAPAEAPVAAEPAAEEDAAPATPPRRPSAAPSAEEGSSLLDTLKSLWFVPVLLLALAGGLFGYRWFRARQQATFDQQLGELAASPEAGDTAIHDLRLRHDTARMHKPVPREENFLVEESGSHERPRIDMAEAAARAPRTVAADETISGETAINFDQGDPLAEADFHMAYGLYDQAADLIRIASAREPQRRDLKLKLLEVFFVWGNRDQFLQTARELAGTRADAAPGEWEKVVIMGKQIAPDDSLFAHDAVSGAAAGGIDLNLEGGQNRVDFDLFGEPSPEQPAAAGVGVDLDLGGEDLGDRDPTGEALTVEPGEVDFLLDDPGAGTDRSGVTTREMTAQLQPEPTVSLAEFNENSEAPTVEQPALQRDEMATVVEKLEGARRQVMPGEQTAELAIDDLGLDLGALDRDESSIPADSEAPTMVAGLDERSRQLMAEAEGRAEGGEGPTESGTWFLSGPDLASEIEAPEAQDAGLTASLRALEATEISPPVDGSETSRLQAIDADSLDLDFGSLEETHPPAGNGASLDLDVGSATELAEGPFAATQQVAAEELALPDLEPVTMSEVGTKLDLARAYMDMGDPEGARSILDEVLHEGSVSQKQEAQRLIESLPG